MGRTLLQIGGNTHSELVVEEGVAVVGKLFRFQRSELRVLLCTFECSNSCVRLLHRVKARVGGGHNFVSMNMFFIVGLLFQDN